MKPEKKKLKGPRIPAAKQSSKKKRPQATTIRKPGKRPGRARRPRRAVPKTRPQPEEAKPESPQPWKLGLSVPPQEQVLSPKTATAVADVPASPVYEMPDWPKPAIVKSIAPVPSKTAVAPAPRKAPQPIPPILLERDTAAEPTVSGPGERYVLGPEPPPEHFPKAEALGTLPESYGTGRLFLTARDPHWLYVTWDLSREEQQRCNTASVDGHLIVRVYAGSADGTPVSEAHVHPESRNWFVHVNESGQRYTAELGYRAADNAWNRVSVSEATLTPPERLSDDTTIQFATLPDEVTLQDVLGVVETAVRENVPLGEAMQQLRTEGFPEQPPVSHALPSPAVPPAQAAVATPAEQPFAGERPTYEAQTAIPAPPTPRLASAPDLPSPAPAASKGTSARRDPVAAEAAMSFVPPAPAVPAAPAFTRAPASRPPLRRLPPPQPWTPAQELDLAKVIRLDEYRRVWMGSVEITELVRRHLHQEISSPPGVPAGGPAAAPGGQPGPAAEEAFGSVTIPFGQSERPKQFWFNLNAEIVIYGATEPDAIVTIGGRRIRLRPDGTFSYRFALPDGQYELPIKAVAIDGEDERSADLQFSRATDYTGHVEHHPQSAELRPPTSVSCGE